MDVTSLCSRLLVAVMVLMVTQINQSPSAQNAGEARPRVTPDRLQFFYHETINISCEEFMGLTGWRVMHKHKKPTNSNMCTPPASSCSIKIASERHSGEFWCEDEDEEGNATGSINISVTDGSVILEVPARPVIEGSDVTLFCKNQKLQSDHIADFYKGGVSLGSEYSHITIGNVSKSHEGFYKCSVSGAGQSPESRLTVGKKENPKPKPNKEILPPQKPFPHHSTVLWTAVSVSLTVVLLFVLGFFLCQKHQVFCKSKSGPHSQENNTVSGQDSNADPLHATYAAVTKTRKKVSVGNKADDVTYAHVESLRSQNEKSSARTQPRLVEDNTIYSSITHW